jgi:hypothetical protein
MLNFILWWLGIYYSALFLVLIFDCCKGSPRK